MSNEDIQPMKLKYSNTSEIPILKINSRMNSQVNLANYGNSNMGSKTGSMVDFKISLVPRIHPRIIQLPIYLNILHHYKIEVGPVQIH